MAPQSVARGPCKAGIGQWRGCQTAPKYTWGANSPLRGRIFLWKTLFRPSRSRPILRNPDGTGLCGRPVLSGIIHSRRRVSRILSPKATVAPAEICSALPEEPLNNHSCRRVSRISSRKATVAPAGAVQGFLKSNQDRHIDYMLAGRLMRAGCGYLPLSMDLLG